MTFEQEVQAAARQGTDAAVAFVATRAGEGDAEAMLMLAQWRCWGHFGPQDIDTAYALTAAAAATGNLQAMLTQAAMIATATGTQRDEAAARALVEGAAPRSPLAAQHLAIADTIPAGAPAVEVLSETPYVARVRGLISAEACAFVMARAAPMLQPSFVIDPDTQARVPHPIRTSAGAAFAPVDEDLVIHTVNLRAAESSGTDIGNGEPLHVLRYTPGQEYRTHLDALPGVENQRTHTVLFYLNGDYDGGETVFPQLGLSVRGEPGDALIFRNTYDDGRADPRAEHAGLPVRAGEKWLATRWIRAHPFHPWKPETER
ncbi:2OG-Fe(II) oxygenase [Sphingomonas sp.]|uniref:prolyl hydroxylase family protein n=1 Tax=Sphingomonas sp. TaxID=28214 RepID=UPI001EBE26EF|nr:2OG-Fe(II) oxygenase [Sphingomonas sp.]MBX3595083.1 2OG-Fe(II) oxygenase [Sphingomonas sp.]